MKRRVSLHLFCGGGGDMIPAHEEGFDAVGVELDDVPLECARRLTGRPVLKMDLGTVEVDEFGRRVLEASGGRMPDLVFMSPPCQGNSGCLPARRAREEKYQQLNSLASRALFLVLSWVESEGAKWPVVVVENVPRIVHRSPEIVQEMGKIFGSFGFIFSQGTHCCGAISGGMVPQERTRWLMIGRHPKACPSLVYEPKKSTVAGLWSAIKDLPLPVPGNKAGKIHEVPAVSVMNALRLALIPPGKDWRAIPREVWLGPSVDALEEAVEVMVSGQHQNGSWGVAGDEPTRTVRASAIIQTTEISVADPRLDHAPRAGSLLVQRDAPSTTVICMSNIGHGQNVADGRVEEGSEAMRAWRTTHKIVRMSDGRLACIGPKIDLQARTSFDVVIEALDGSYHRPMTVLEMARAQGFPMMTRGAWLAIPGTKEQQVRIIGNAVPPPAAKSIISVIRQALDRQGGLSGLLAPADETVWVKPLELLY